MDAIGLCPVCGHPSTYDPTNELIHCDNLDDTCPVSPAVCGEIHNIRGRWDALCLLLNPRPVRENP